MNSLQESAFQSAIRNGQYRQAEAICERAMREDEGDSIAGLSVSTMLTRIEDQQMPREEIPDPLERLGLISSHFQERVDQCVKTLLGGDEQPEAGVQLALRQLQPSIDAATLCRLVLDNNWTFQGWEELRLMQRGVVQTLLDPSVAAQSDLPKEPIGLTIEDEDRSPEEDQDPNLEDSDERRALALV